MSVPTLPHDDPFPKIRAELTQLRRGQRAYDYSSPIGTACLDELLLVDKPGPDYLLAIVTESVAAYQVCQSRIAAVEQALEKALGEAAEISSNPETER